MPSFDNLSKFLLDSTGFLRTEPIEIVVGAEEAQTSFYIHKGLLIDSSDFFEKALNPKWLESDKRVVKLPEDEPAVFAIYQQVLYTDTRNLPRLSQCGQPELEGGCIAAEYTMLSKLYVLAEKLMDSRLKTMALDAMRGRSEVPDQNGVIHYPLWDCVQIIYDGTPVGSHARSLLVELYSAHGDSSFLTDSVEDAPKDFLFELSQRMLSDRMRHKDFVAAIEIKNSELKQMKDQVGTLSQLLKRKGNVKDLQSRRNAADTTAPVPRLPSAFSEPFTRRQGMWLFDSEDDPDSD